jgi:hypothetical protein
MDTIWEGREPEQRSAHEAGEIKGEIVYVTQTKAVGIEASWIKDVGLWLNLIVRWLVIS